MGRKRKNFVPNITEDNQLLADDFIRYIAESGLYDEYRRKFVSSGHWDEDVYQETVLRVYQAILYNGMDGKIKVTMETPEEERHDIFRNKFFISCKQNNTVGLTSDRYKTRRSDNDVLHLLKDEVFESAEEKTRRDLFEDFKILKTLEYVEEHFSDVDSHLFKIYYLVPGTTYKKLQEMTKLKDARTRVVEINRMLRKNRELLEKKIAEEFEKQYSNERDF